MTTATLSEEARYLRFYRERPDRWVNHKIDIELARYRERAELEAWLEKQPPTGHKWLRQRLEDGRVVLDGSQSYQANALHTMGKPGFYAFKWANGTAKTTTAALWVHWFLDCWPGGKLLTTAGTWSQLKEQLWREIATWAERAKAPITSNAVPVNKTQIDIAPDWFAFGRAAEKAATFEGVHAPAAAVLFDEAKAIKPEIFEAVRRILRGNPGGRFWWVCLSSPGSPSGPFYDITQGDQAHRWTTFSLSAYESERVSLEQIAADREDLGETSPLFVAMNLGDFPDETEDTICPLSWVLAAVDRRVSERGIKSLGVDVARFGNDETVFARFTGRKGEIVEAYAGKDLMQTASRIQRRKTEVDMIGIDDAGLGGGVTDRCREEGINVIALNAGQAAIHGEQFADLGSEMAWEVREALREGFEAANNEEKGMSLPSNKKLLHQLSARKYEFFKGRIKAEGKDKMRKRGLRSPDYADALGNAWWVRVRGAGLGDSSLSADEGATTSAMSSLAGGGL